MPFCQNILGQITSCFVKRDSLHQQISLTVPINYIDNVCLVLAALLYLLILCGFSVLDEIVSTVKISAAQWRHNPHGVSELWNFVRLTEH